MSTILTLQFLFAAVASGAFPLRPPPVPASLSLSLLPSALARGYHRPDQFPPPLPADRERETLTSHFPLFFALVVSQSVESVAARRAVAVRHCFHFTHSLSGSSQLSIRLPALPRSALALTRPLSQSQPVRVDCFYPLNQPLPFPPPSRSSGNTVTTRGI